MTIRRSTVLALAVMLVAMAMLIGARSQAHSAATITIATHQNEFAPGTQNMGWWNEVGIHAIGNDNYIAGYDQTFENQYQRDFFSFDTSLAGGKCASAATLQLPIGTGSGDNGQVATLANFVLHDVSTDPVTLNTTAGPDTSIFHDLGTGTVYGNRVLPTRGPYGGLTSFPVSLNHAGLAALNAAIKAPHPGYFSVGGMIQGEAPDVWLFGFTPVLLHTGDYASVKLVLTLGSC